MERGLAAATEILRELGGGGGWQIREKPRESKVVPSLRASPPWAQALGPQRPPRAEGAKERTRTPNFPMPLSLPAQERIRRGGFPAGNTGGRADHQLPWRHCQETAHLPGPAEPGAPTSGTH